ncbi:hypothetical protein [Cyclobacterium marinum]|uniref:Uncharacterized protein n=1 Tax=Cyclobacterium marinum (strain ATCC 25205 / DSM 745 / LMG 13164 / NCIMB 1802) TaxID=880070 RepID=G0IY07_CYCMS|nr:hypothetical protein [Cyclobacterium marinum]AEL24340.1 hypothetical protein Cycma_0565 [Cyclobacterium marinum DSM 745]
MTTQEYINNNRTGTFKQGDKVVMHTCAEASHYRGKVWECMTDSYKDRGGSDVVFLNDFSGCFSTKFLQIVNN